MNEIDRMGGDVSDEDALASLVTNDYIVPLLPENMFGAEFEIRRRPARSVLHRCSCGRKEWGLGRRR